MTEIDEFLRLHKSQLESSGVPEHFWKTVHKKITNEVFDANDAFSLALLDYGDEARSHYDPVHTVHVCKPFLQPSDSENIYLIDHAWTFRVQEASRQLQEYPQLSERMAKMFGVTDAANRNEAIFSAMWRYSQFYTVCSNDTAREDRVPIWYIMDELGQGIKHSDSPNSRIVPFLHIPTNTFYSLLFPIVLIQKGSEVTRDFVESTAMSSDDRNALLLPWVFTDFTSKSFSPKMPNEEYFTSGHIPETLPDPSIFDARVERCAPLKVFVEYSVVAEKLTSESFEITDSFEDADILWLIKHFKDFEELSLKHPKKFINQFPYEYVITIKDLLAVTCRRRNQSNFDVASLKSFPSWLPTTFNLKTEITEFVSYFQHREQSDMDNHWIIKPWNLARGLDIHITNNISQIMRLATTGPKIVQKYVENPVLFYRKDLACSVKFDIRYVLLLKSVDPLETYICKKFFLRFANKSFSLDELYDYQKHFTVMNYTEDAQLNHLRCEEFLLLWEEQYPDFKWHTIEEDICDMFNEVFLCAVSEKPPCGIAASPQSRALYAADLILAWEGNKIQPKLLEINWMPDCKRAGDYYPEYLNNIFELLFCNKINEEEFGLITKTHSYKISDIKT